MFKLGVGFYFFSVSLRVGTSVFVVVVVFVYCYYFLAQYLNLHHFPSSFVCCFVSEF